jgi:hypothetical protein
MSFFLRVLFCLLPLAAAAQRLAPPLPQPPFRWEDFSVSGGYTTLKANGKTVDSARIGAFLRKPGKGAVRQSFQNALLSGQPKRYPFEYQYETRTSPDGRLHLIYRYDYSQPVLLAKGKVLNADFSVKQTFEMPVDDGLIVHGHWLNNQGDVFAVYTDADDGAYVVRQRPDNQTDWLEIGADATRRHGFAATPDADGRLHVAWVNEDGNGRWLGITVAAFDFGTSNIDLLFHAADPTQAPGGRCDIAELRVSPTETVVVVRKVDILANAYVYDPFAALDPGRWIARKQKTQSGKRITFIINAATKAVRTHVQDGQSAEEF